MLYELLYPLKNLWSPLNLFQYITFRSTMAAITALSISFLVGPWIIQKIKLYQIGEEIRETGPNSSAPPYHPVCKTGQYIHSGNSN